MATDFTSASNPGQLKRLLSFGLDESESQERACTGKPLDLFMERPGSRLDRYELERVIGEGAVGVVYLAHQQRPVKRQVALKILKPGMDSKAIVGRFEAERQALALLDHPNIAHVHDAGITEDRRPYFVMEYVEGPPITEYCDQHRFTMRERLELFAQVCQAVHHAHQKGIIHRDIKPSNILVFEQDGQAVPKVIDFGLAKAVRGTLSEQTLVTEQGQLLGTPEYMSPEQAEMANSDVDIRSDVYSLGVLLYVLLTGVLPFESKSLREGGISNARGILRDQEPRTPSKCLTSLGQKAREVALARRTDLTTLRKLLRRELQLIPLKAMRKEREERYQSVLELVGDVTNYLHGAPLIAGPPGAAYRIKKLLRRNRTLVTSVAAILVVLVAGIIATTTFALKARESRDEAAAVVGFLEQDVFGTLDPWSDAGREVGVEELLQAATGSIEAKFADQPLVEARVRKTLGLAFHRLGRLEEAEHHLQRALDIFQDKRGETDPTTLETLFELGSVYFFQQRIDKAEMVLSEALEGSKHTLGDHHQLTLKTMCMLGTVIMNALRYEEAEALLVEALNRTREILGPEHQDTLFCMCCLAIWHRDQKELDEAEALLTNALEEMDHGLHRMWAPGSAHRLYFKTYLAKVYMDQGRCEEAEKLARETWHVASQVLGRGHRETINTMITLARICEAQNRYDDAEELLLEAIAIRNEEPAVSPDWRWPRYALGYLYIHCDREEEAQQVFLEGMNIHRRSLGEDHWLVLWTARDLARLWDRRGKQQWADRYQAMLPETGQSK